MRKARDNFLFMYISLESLLEVLVQLSPPNTQTADLTITLKVHPTYPRQIMSLPVYQSGVYFVSESAMARLNQLSKL